MPSSMVYTTKNETGAATTSVLPTAGIGAEGSLRRFPVNKLAQQVEVANHLMACQFQAIDLRWGARQEITLWGKKMYKTVNILYIKN